MSAPKLERAYARARIRRLRADYRARAAYGIRAAVECVETVGPVRATRRRKVGA